METISTSVAGATANKMLRKVSNLPKDLKYYQ
jgi:hypothetical protein